MISVGCDSTRVIHAKGTMEAHQETLTVTNQANRKFLIVHAEPRYLAPCMRKVHQQSHMWIMTAAQPMAKPFGCLGK